ncbi:FAD-dependent oxidoreductase [Lactobacillus acetotolerans]|jgi:fumarate reductase flavoprotein subunit|uniref:FAD-dependent oxidoreductase n=1 Tax=Lactobacillus acetotolerans TaxID=1600 RepID=UPI0019D0E3FB|nr:FAD-dependent oxidoreductase [Lactobacillus acetotolerans]MBN7276976.1 FAD-dependent oxidoreductase [Lactobacillus acetotolerans]
MELKNNYDVIIVGGGAAGFTAAYEASNKGLSVLVVEKGKTLGGSGNYIEGAFAVDSFMQKKHADYHLTKSAALDEELTYSHYKADTNTWKQYIDGSADIIKWLKDLGVEYFDVEPLGSGARTWHLFKGRGDAVINKVLAPKAKQQGTDILSSTEVTKLISENGKITGVEIKDLNDNSISKIKGKNIILATGGYLNNKEMIAQYTNYDANQLIPVNSYKNTGDGLSLAWKVGAQRYAMGMAMLFGGYIKDPDKPSHVYRYDELNGAANQQSLLWVNETGKRFVNEEVVDNFAQAGNALFTQNEFYTILDQATIDHLQNNSLYKAMGTYDYHDTKLPQLQEEIDKELADGAKYLTKADSIEELAKELNLPDLPETINRYNEQAHAGKDKDFGKNSKFMVPVEKGPFYAIKQGVGAFCTMGGLKINLDNQVLDQNGSPIKGLYAVGNDAAGMLIGDTYGPNMPGTEAGYCFFSGKHTADVIAEK